MFQPELGERLCEGALSGYFEAKPKRTTTMQSPYFDTSPNCQAIAKLCSALHRFTVNFAIYQLALDFKGGEFLDRCLMLAIISLALVPASWRIHHDYPWCASCADEINKPLARFPCFAWFPCL